VFNREKNIREIVVKKGEYVFNIAPEFVSLMAGENALLFLFDIFLWFLVYIPFAHLRGGIVLAKNQYYIIYTLLFTQCSTKCL